jgi:hypothetical protein
MICNESGYWGTSIYELLELGSDSLLVSELQPIKKPIVNAIRKPVLNFLKN